VDVVDGPETQVAAPGAAGHDVTAVRPFLERGRALSMPPDAADAGRPGSGVRAYAITGGRAHASVHLEFETMLQATALGCDSRGALRFERGDIVRLCDREPLSVAELSARLHLPIGVVRVVAADLLGERMVEAFHPSENVADDVLLITRLIAGVRAL
jgi:Protein of unknown function (DUF742)